MSRLTAVLLALFVVVPAFAQVVVLPAAPTGDHFIQLSVTGPSCPGLTRAVRNGAFIDIESDTPPVCIATPPTVTTILNVGYLPDGTYTIRFVDTSAPPVRRVTDANAGTFTVTGGRSIEVVPPAPSTAHFVSVTVTHPECIPVVAAVRNGSFIDIHATPHEVCLGAEPTYRTTFGIGHLPAGTYTFRTLNMNNPGAPVVMNANAGSVVVAQSHGGEHIPTLDAKGILELTIAIAIAASIALRRAL